MEIPLNYIKKEGWGTLTSSRGLVIPNSYQRERRNDEHPIQPPVRNNDPNNLVKEEIDEEYIDNLEDIHILYGRNNTMHLTCNDYEDSLNISKKTPQKNPMKKYHSLLNA